MILSIVSHINKLSTVKFNFLLDDKKSVRFSKTCEIRSLPDSTSESIARMSHVNAARARQGRRIHRSAAKLTHVAKV